MLIYPSHRFIFIYLFLYLFVISVIFPLCFSRSLRLFHLFFLISLLFISLFSFSFSSVFSLLLSLLFFSLFRLLFIVISFLVLLLSPTTFFIISYFSFSFFPVVIFYVLRLTIIIPNYWSKMNRCIVSSFRWLRLFNTGYLLSLKWLKCLFLVEMSRKALKTRIIKQRRRRRRMQVMHWLIKNIVFSSWWRDPCNIFYQQTGRGAVI